MDGKILVVKFWRVQIDSPIFSTANVLRYSVYYIDYFISEIDRVKGTSIFFSNISIPQHILHGQLHVATCYQLGYLTYLGYHNNNYYSFSTGAYKHQMFC